jgi:hypothetical protein
MSLTTVFSVRLRPERARVYQEGVRRICARAAERKDAFHWTTHQPIAGDVGLLHFVSRVDDWAALAARDATPQLLILRLFGESDGAKLGEELVGCTMEARTVIGRDRPDLSYPPDGSPAARAASPLAVVTTIRARAGQQDACEELIRKIAEAIPKVDEPARIATYQTLIGDLRSYWTVRPIDSLAELDRQSIPSDLLVRAFGPSEGGLVYRSGIESMETVERSILTLRPDLSHTS